MTNSPSEWKEITSHMHKAKNAIQATHYKEASHLMTCLKSMKSSLEQIQRALEIYLESKRQLFPRFYFISNDDLLEILGSSARPEPVQPHLRKLFDNLIKLKLKVGFFRAIACTI